MAKRIAAKCRSCGASIYWIGGNASRGRHGELITFNPDGRRHRHRRPPGHSHQEEPGPPTS